MLRYVHDSLQTERRKTWKSSSPTWRWSQPQGWHSVLLRSSWQLWLSGRSDSTLVLFPALVGRRKRTSNTSRGNGDSYHHSGHTLRDDRDVPHYPPSTLAKEEVTHPHTQVLTLQKDNRNLPKGKPWQRDNNYGSLQQLQR